MKPSFRVYFLLVLATSALHLSWWRSAIILLCYYALESLDAWISKRAKDKALEYELADWEIDQDDPEMESKGDLTRRRLSGNDQVIVTRLSEFIWRIRGL
jgi:hypothetical protein